MSSSDRKNANISVRVRNDNVTGSSLEFTVRANGTSYKYIVDKGLFLGDNVEQEENFLIEEYKDILAVFLSHAHVDHCGQIPHMCKSDGYTGPIYMSKATAAISQKLILDEYYVLSQRDDYVVTKEDNRAFRRMINQTKICDIYENIQFPNATFAFLDNAHTLGSNMVYFTTKHAISNIGVLVTGDYRRGHPFIKTRSNSSFLKKRKVDVLFLESTYGDREKDDLSTTLTKLNVELMKVIARGGSALIPVFAFDRGQVLLYYLSQLQQMNHELSNIPIYVDGKLFQEITHIYTRFKEKFNCKVTDLIPKNMINIVGKVERQKVLNDKSPKIVLATSGQMHAGSVMKHIFNMVEEPLNGIISVGYVGHKAGRTILDACKGDIITYGGRELTVNCTTAQLNGFSAHADRDELADFVKKIAENNPNLNVVLYHGSPEAKAQLKEYIVSKGILPANKITIPTSKQMLKIDKHTLSSGCLVEED